MLKQQYAKASKERQAVGAVMTAEIEDDIKTQCEVDACFNKEYKRVSAELDAVHAVMTADIEDNIKAQCASASK